MSNKIKLISLALALTIWPTVLQAQPESQTRTIVDSPTAAKKLVGKHKLNLQWIGSDNWVEFGNLKVTDRQGLMLISGNQAKGEDYLHVNGKIVRIEDKQFTFQGKIVTQVSHMNKGEACERDGEMIFKITENTGDCNKCKVPVILLPTMLISSCGDD
jgi:hypothetical protein